MRVWLSTAVSHESHESGGDVEPMVGLAVRLRTLQALGAEMPVRVPRDFADLLARAGLPLVAGGMMSAMLAGGWL